MDYSRIFYWLIDMSIKGSLLIISIILIKLLLKNKLGARWHYSIWFLALTRLVIPFAPQSSISIFNLFTIGDHKNIISKNYTKYNPNEIISWFSDKITEPSLLQSDSFKVSFTKYLGLFMEKSIYFKLVLVWFTVVILLLLFIIIANVKFGLNIKRNSFNVSNEIIQILEQCKDKMGIGVNLPIIHTSAVKAPALYGVIHPRILLPVNIEKCIGKNELQYILFHELSHYKRKDIIVFWIMTILKIIHWFNPVIWYGFYQMRQDCEISCDALALSYIDYNDCKEYGKTIIHLLQNTIRPVKHFGVAGMLDSKFQLKRRIKMITLFKKNAYRLSLVSVVVIILMGCMFLTNAKEEDTNSINNNIQLEEEIQSSSVSDINDNETDNSQAGVLSEEASQNMIWPLPNSTKILSPYGWRVHPVLKEKKLHTGTDIQGEKGALIVASAEGTVIFSEMYGAYGRAVIIDHGDGVVTLYGHCSELLVEKDQKVKAGDEIAKVGSTGAATGPHLHFEIRKDGETVDPFKGYLDNKYKKANDNK